MLSIIGAFLLLLIIIFLFILTPKLNKIKPINNVDDLGV